MPTIKTGMILAAGRGVRMKELTDNCPKPLVRVCGETLIGHIINKMEHYGLKKIVINTCYKGEMIKEAVKKYSNLNFVFSDEETALETGGGVKNALHYILPEGENGFFVLNADPLWEEPKQPILNALAENWNPQTMDALLAIIPISLAKGDAKDGDFFIENNKLRRKKEREKNIPYLFMGIQILHPRVFENTPNGAFSLRDIYDKAQKNNRLAHIIYNGRWFHVGTPEALAETEKTFCLKEEK